jgi:hypothetical protein
MAPVEYNGEIKQLLDLSVVSTFAVPDAVTSVNFSRDGRYFSVVLSNEETHIYDMTMYMISVLVDRGCRCRCVCKVERFMDCAI